MAVFQRTENQAIPNNSISLGFSFCQFEREIGELDGKLKVGGLLVIEHTDFDFRETVYGDSYKNLDLERSDDAHASVLPEYNRPLFDRHDRKISDEQCLPRVFVKRSRTRT
jgi:hypothetical protein